MAQIVRLAHDLIAWTQRLLLTGELATAEPKRLRYRLLHVAARLAFHARTATLRLQASWPWAADLAAAFSALGVPRTSLTRRTPPRTNPLPAHAPREACRRPRQHNHRQHPQHPAMASTGPTTPAITNPHQPPNPNHSHHADSCTIRASSHATSASVSESSLRSQRTTLPGGNRDASPSGA